MQELVEVLEAEPKASWSLAKLSELYSFVIGGDWGKGPDEDLDADYEQVYCIRGSELRNWKQEKGSSASLRKVKSSSLAKRKLEIGDIILEISGGGPEQPVGRTALIDEDVLAFEPDTPKVCTNFLRLLRLSSQVDSKYINYYLTFFYYTGEVVKYQGGSNNLRNLKFDEYSDINVPLPPLAEQKRIVAKLDALMEKVEVARERLEAIPETLKQFRQRVLAHAVSGKLTEEWRRENPNVESAKELLEKVRNLRVERFKAECKTAVLEGKRRPKSLAEEHEVPKDELPSIQQTWEWSFLQNIAELKGGVTKGRDLKDCETVEVPYLRVANVQDDYLDLNEVLTIAVKVIEVEKYLLEAGDILFTEGGDRDKLGRGTIWQNEIDTCIHQNHIFRARVNKELILPKFISIVTKSQFSRDYFFNNAKQSVNLASINITKLGNLQVPIPPLAEQYEIVDKVEELYSWTDKVKESYNQALEKLEKLPQALLAKAFRGELVPQDPSDEPASELLERIQAAREGQKKGRGGKAA